MSDSKTPKVKLDWSQLLIFDQANLNTADAKEAGRLRLEGKEYVVQEGDVMHFRFNV